MSEPILTEEELRAYSDNNNDLYQVLKHCSDNGLVTRYCCAGHNRKDTPYIAMDIPEQGSNEYKYFSELCARLSKEKNTYFRFTNKNRFIIYCSMKNRKWVFNQIVQSFQNPQNELPPDMKALQETLKKYNYLKEDVHIYGLSTPQGKSFDIILCKENYDMNSQDYIKTLKQTIRHEYINNYTNICKSLGIKPKRKEGPIYNESRLFAYIHGVFLPTTKKFISQADHTFNQIKLIQDNTRKTLEQYCTEAKASAIKNLKPYISKQPLKNRNNLQR